eukprot:GEMP01055376.1.p1 GENE.GEMP01055376.1~~GEMP01055376.1.p1  ORF type:complete len:137 (-),score=17.59 GEMP01055376.1:407-817(-)
MEASGAAKVVHILQYFPCSRYPGGAQTGFKQAAFLFTYVAHLLVPTSRGDIGRHPLSHRLFNAKISGGVRQAEKMNTLFLTMKKRADVHVSNTHSNVFCDAAGDTKSFDCLYCSYREGCVVVHRRKHQKILPQTRN